MKSIIRRIRHGLQWMVFLFFATSILTVLLYRFVPVVITPLMVIRCIQQIGKGEKVVLKHHWISIEKMSEHLPMAVMASEDQRFMEHNGFDFEAIKIAIDERKDKKRKRGASTISQQTAKNVFLWPSSNWVRKGFESYFTLLIELMWSKKRIMEVYLNSIEMGYGIYGAEAVAQQHFGRSAKKLSKPNCALIAATLPNPIRFNSAKPSQYLIKRQSWIMRQMMNFPNVRF